MLRVRLLPTETGTGSFHMAADEILALAAAEQRVAAFRFYTWIEPTLSLGYFQSATARLVAPTLAWVRRASGGATIFHDAAHELTYSLALPPDVASRRTGESWICDVHHVIRDRLIQAGIPARAVVCGEERKLGEVWCFQHHTPGDLTIDGAKVVGSAQRKVRGALSQHGTILLARSPHTPLAGIAELAKPLDPTQLIRDLVHDFAKVFSWEFEASEWTASERDAIAHLEQHKFRSPDWNEKR